MRVALDAEGNEVSVDTEVQQLILYSCFVVTAAFVGSMDQESSQQLHMWFSEQFSLQNLLCSLSRVLFLLWCNKYGAKRCPENHIPFDF